MATQLEADLAASEDHRVPDLPGRAGQVSDDTSMFARGEVTRRWSPGSGTMSGRVSRRHSVTGKPDDEGRMGAGPVTKSDSAERRCLGDDHLGECQVAVAEVLDGHGPGQFDCFGYVRGRGTIRVDHEVDAEHTLGESAVRAEEVRVTDPRDRGFHAELMSRKGGDDVDFVDGGDGCQQIEGTRFQVAEHPGTGPVPFDDERVEIVARLVAAERVLLDHGYFVTVDAQRPGDVHADFACPDHQSSQRGLFREVRFGGTASAYAGLLAESSRL